MPNIYAENTRLMETLTTNWKDGAAEGSQQTQIAAFLVILAQLYFGSTAEGSTALTVGTLTYAGSSLLGYFNLATTPVLRLTRLNALTAVLATMSVGSIVTGYGSLATVALFLTMLYDGFRASTHDSRAERLGENERADPQTEFITTSWRNNSFNTDTENTARQGLQMMMSFMIMFLGMVCGAEG